MVSKKEAHLFKSRHVCFLPLASVWPGSVYETCMRRSQTQRDHAVMCPLGHATQADLTFARKKEKRKRKIHVNTHTNGFCPWREPSKLTFVSPSSPITVSLSPLLAGDSCVVVVFKYPRERTQIFLFSQDVGWVRGDGFELRSAEEKGGWTARR